MSSGVITIGNPYTPVAAMKPPTNPHTQGWVTPPKPKELVRKSVIKKNEKAIWAREGCKAEDVYTQDLLPAMYEDTEKRVDKNKFPDQDDYVNNDSRFGKRLLHTEFIRKVLSMNYNLICEDSVGSAKCAAFYEMKHGDFWDAKKACMAYGNYKVYTGACFRKGWLPEWTIMAEDAAGQVTMDGLQYGWRTVLQRLLQKGAITYYQIITVFGEVTRTDICGKNWLLNTMHFR